MPEGKLLNFRVIQGSKIPEPELVAPEGDPDSVRECLATASNSSADYAQVFVIYKDHEGTFDFWYSTTTDAEKLLLIEKAKAWLMSFD